MHVVLLKLFTETYFKFVSCFRLEDSNKRPPGTPGTPGSRDLQAALRRLSLRRDNYLSEKRFLEEERERKLAYLSKEDEKGGGESSGGPGTPTESLLSMCSHPSLGSVWSGYSFTARSYLPDKLQIVKPLEGDDSSQSHRTRSENVNPTDNGQKASHDKQNQTQSTAQNSNCVPPQSYTQIYPPQTHNQSRAIQKQQQKQYVIFHKGCQSKIFLSATQDRTTLRKSSSLLELSSMSSSKSPPRAPVALVTGLLEALEQQGGSLNLQHSFYFRHTQPRCWFEL